MVAVHAGSDTYGRVKKVGSTPVVTKFGMVSAFPLFPLESYYYAGEGNPQGIPFVYTSKAIYGLPLARLDTLSVLMAYARGIFGALTVAGFFYFIMLYIEWIGGNGRGPDAVALAMRNVLLLCLLVGVSGGLLTYLVPFQITHREMQIRSACAEVLGISADPANVRADIAHAILANISKQAQQNPIPRPAGVHESADKHRYLALQLVAVRAQIALGEEPESREIETDDLLRRISASEQT